jgi:hypothetical protein
VPDPLAEQAWLFPGKHPGQPLTHRHCSSSCASSGFPLNEARISALRQLVLQAPAPVIAAALGVHHHHTTSGGLRLFAWLIHGPASKSPLPPAPIGHHSPPGRSRMSSGPSAISQPRNRWSYSARGPFTFARCPRVLPHDSSPRLSK